MNADCGKSVVAAVAEIPIPLIPRTEPSTEYRLTDCGLTHKEKPKAEKLKQVARLASY